MVYLKSGTVNVSLYVHFAILFADKYIFRSNCISFIDLTAVVLQSMVKILTCKLLNTQLNNISDNDSKTQGFFEYIFTFFILDPHV